MLNPINSPPASFTNSLLVRTFFGAMTYAPSFSWFAARRTAAKIPTWLPHRHTRLWNAFLISASRGIRILSSSVLAVITQPFRQYPHWKACSSMNAFCTGWDFRVVPAPRALRFPCPPLAIPPVRHDRTARFPPCTVHAPHCPSPQPNRGLFISRSSRSTYSRGQSGSTSTSCGRPFTFKVAWTIVASSRAV